LSIDIDLEKIAMSLYSDTELEIAAQTEVLHEDELLSFARIGTWGTAAQRTAIVAEARKARCAAGVQESVGDEALAVALGGINIDRDFCQQAQADGVTEGAYVEIVGLAARLAHLDVFARGIGVPVRRLGAPVEDREPSRERSSVAKKEGFFTASIPSAPAGGELAVSLFGNQPAPNILRSLSLVPDEARRLNALLNQEYFSMETIFDFTYSSHNSITRPQLELIAAKVSELNQCFY
jgi:hypothetical protein